HGVDVAEGVGGGDGPEVVGPVHDRREEVGGEDEGEVVGELVDGGVVAGGAADEDVGVADFRQQAEQRQQVAGRLLGGAAGALGELRQSDGVRRGRGGVHTVQFIPATGGPPRSR